MAFPVVGIFTFRIGAVSFQEGSGSAAWEMAALATVVLMSRAVRVIWRMVVVLIVMG